MIKMIIAVSLGSACGGLLRWFLSEKLNPFFSFSFSAGTLVSNLIAGYIVGFAYAFFAQNLQLSVEARLFLMTGFCGGLSTFSTFSLEVVKTLQDQEWSQAFLVIALNLLGSITMTFLGIWSYNSLKNI